MISKLIFDIETVPDENMLDDLKPEVSLGNLKDPVKVAAKIKEWEKGQIKKMSVSPFMNQVISIQAWSTIENKFIEFDGYSTEAGKINFIMELIGLHDLVIGHNIVGFDLTTIKMRAMVHGIILPGKFKALKKYSDFPFYDTMQQLAGWDSSQWKGLDWWCRRLGIEGKSNHGSNVYQMWKEGKQSEIDEYCRDDVRATKELYDRIHEFY